MRIPVRRRLVAVAVVLALVALLAFGGYVAFGSVIFDRLTKVDANCGGRWASNTPAAFSARQDASDTYSIDTTPYLMPGYQTVSFPSRGDAAVSISAWWVPGTSASAPAVVVVPGLGDCKRWPAVLLPAGMLHRDGFSVLLIDLRNEGASTRDTGRYTGGIREYRDVLGAFDWLRATKGIPAGRIGVLGMSLGAATAMVAMGQEQAIAAIWEDSGFADINVAISDELARNGYPTWLSIGAVIAGRLEGVDITSLSPLEAMARLNGRPIEIVHGTADTRLPVKHAYALRDAVEAHGGHPEVWILPGVAHVQAVFDDTAEYERRLDAFFDAALGKPGSETGSAGPIGSMAVPLAPPARAMSELVRAA